MGDHDLQISHVHAEALATGSDYQTCTSEPPIKVGFPYGLHADLRRRSLAHLVQQISDRGHQSVSQRRPGHPQALTVTV